MLYQTTRKEHGREIQKMTLETVSEAAQRSLVHEPSRNYYNQDPYGTQAYGHVAGGSPCRCSSVFYTS